MSFFGTCTIQYHSYMAHIQDKTVDKVGLEGPGLVFIVYPEAIAMMSGSVFWSIIFFLMLITLGIDSTFGGLEAMITALCDEYPRMLGRRREIFVLVLLIGIYLCALPTTTYVSIIHSSFFFSFHFVVFYSRFQNQFTLNSLYTYRFLVFVYVPVCFRFIYSLFKLVSPQRNIYLLNTPWANQINMTH